jgi:hypothetical protein
MSQAYDLQETDKLGNFKGITPSGYTEFIGAEWKKECDPETGRHTLNVSRAQYAAKIRAALKVKTDTDFGTFEPDKVKLSVRTKNYAGGGSITITIEDIADMWRFDYREDCEIREQVKQIASQWVRSSTHALSDYYSSNFILFVNYGPMIEDDIYDLGPRPTPTIEEYRARAIEQYNTDSNYEIAVDETAGVTPVNDGEGKPDYGAWVEARVWIPLSDFEGDQ